MYQVGDLRLFFPGLAQSGSAGVLTLEDLKNLWNERLYGAWSSISGRDRHTGG